MTRIHSWHAPSVAPTVVGLFQNLLQQLNRLPKTAALCVICFLFPNLPAAASDIVWTNVAGGNWSVAANWDLRRLPVPGDDVHLTNNGNYTVTVRIADPAAAAVFAMQSRAALGTVHQTIDYAIKVGGTHLHRLHVDRLSW